MNQSATSISPAPEAVHGAVDLEFLDGWSPTAEASFTCYTIALEPSAS